MLDLGADTKIRFSHVGCSGRVICSRKLVLVTFAFQRLSHLSSVSFACFELLSLSSVMGYAEFTWREAEDLAEEVADEVADEAARQAEEAA